MTKLLLIALVKICSNETYTPIQTQECVSVYGNCVANYNNEQEAFEKCTKKWNKIKNEIK